MYNIYIYVYIWREKEREIILIRIHVYIYIYIYTYIHTSYIYIYIYIHMWGPAEVEKYFSPTSGAFRAALGFASSIPDISIISIIAL